MNNHLNKNEESVIAKLDLEKIAEKKKHKDLEKNKRKTKLSQALRNNLMRRKNSK